MVRVTTPDPTTTPEPTTPVPAAGPAQAPAPDHDAAIGAFWEWWAAEGRTMADAALASGDVQTLVDPLTIRVHAISEELAWELASGAALGSEHELTVTAEGNADVRALARRWLRAQGSRRRVVGIPIPGEAGRAMANGGLLAEAPEFRGEQTFEAFLAAGPPSL